MVAYSYFPVLLILRYEPLDVVESCAATLDQLLTLNGDCLA